MRNKNILISLALIVMLIMIFSCPASVVAENSNENNPHSISMENPNNCRDCHYDIRTNIHHTEETIDEFGCFPCHVNDTGAVYLEKNCTVCHNGEIAQIHHEDGHGNGKGPGGLDCSLCHLHHDHDSKEQFNKGQWRRH